MKREKIQVRICVGTACFVQGGADLLLYGDFLNPDMLGECEIEGTSCLGGCKQAGSTELKAPFVEINGKIYGNVTQERFIQLLGEAMHA
ncbi:MAG: NAD(P)H-dependent oxidoreductase subunit E [Sphaerochaetaceae bacterium]